MAVTRRRRIEASKVVENGVPLPKEAERTMKYIKEDSYVVTLEIQGKMLLLRRTCIEGGSSCRDYQGKSHITFVIGGSIGLGEAVLKRFGFCVEFFQNDISPSVDARDSSGTDLSKLSDQFQRALPTNREEKKQRRDTIENSLL